MQILSSILWVVFSCVVIIGGVAGMLAPLAVVDSLALLLPIFLCVGGVVDIAYYWRVRAFQGAQILLLDGIFSLLFALIFFSMERESTALTIIYFVAFLAMFRGILAFVYAFDIKSFHAGAFWLMLLLGVLNVAISMLFIIFPQLGGITIGVVVSLFVMLFGIASLLGWWSVRKFFTR